MDKNVSFRNKRSIANGSNQSCSGSWNLTRPKSWGEFQSGLKTFQPIKRPTASTKPNGNRELSDNATINGNGSMKGNEGKQ